MCRALTGFILGYKSSMHLLAHSISYNPIGSPKLLFKCKWLVLIRNVMTLKSGKLIQSIGKMMITFKKMCSVVFMEMLIAISRNIKMQMQILEFQ